MNEKTSIYPTGATNANWFSLCNAVSFQITLGSPMILYAKSLGATSTVLGIIAAMTPLLTIAQIPAAHFLGRIGYRRFILMGWGSRTIFIFLIACVPLFSFLNNLGKISLVLFSLFIFNLVRGVSSGAWLPWLTDLIPEDVRGRFLSRDQIFMHAGSLMALLVAAMLLRGTPKPWQFTAIFLISACGGVVSLLFLNRIPDIMTSETLLKSNTRVPWKEIVTYPPFFRLVIFTLIWVFTVGAVGVFSVAFLKSKIGYSESRILIFAAFFFSGALASLPLIGRLLDRTGSKIMLQAAIAISVTYHSLFWLLSAGTVTPSMPLLCTMNFVNGMAGAMFSVAHVRLVMNTMPIMGRSHFFAFFTVIASLGLGISPILWGIVIDAIGKWERWTGPFEWNRFSVFYFAVVVLLFVVAGFSISLQEKPRGTPRIDPRETVFKANLRRLARFWQR